MAHPQKVPLKIFGRSDLIWLRYSRSKTCLFVCLSVCLFVDLFVFYFNYLGTPTGIYPENFVKNSLHLAEIIRIRKLDCKMFILFVCLFVCLCICLFFALIMVEYLQEVSLKLS